VLHVRGPRGIEKPARAALVGDVKGLAPDLAECARKMHDLLDSFQRGAEGDGIGQLQPAGPRGYRTEALDIGAAPNESPSRPADPGKSLQEMGADESACARHQDHVRLQLFREVLAKKDENTGSGLPAPHFGHFNRLLSRSLIPMVSVNFLPHSRHLKS
jgi:hypothetical protein